MPKIKINPEIPTKNIHDYWVWAFRATDIPMVVPNSGKWMMFYDKSVIDEKWMHVKSLLKEGLLGDLAKCSTAKSNPSATNPNTKVIIIYTSDHTNTDEVYRVAKVLYEKLDYNKKMYYKTDEQTYAGLYAIRGSKKNHIYHYPI